MIAALATAPLTAADRCDRCGARAYIRVVLAGGGDLLFCGHHGRRHEAVLREQSVQWQDETAQLVETTAASAPAEER